MSYFLGLDASTSCVGWAIVESGERLIAHGSFDLSKYKGFVDKANQLKYHLKELKATYKVGAIGIESILQITAVGSAHTICVLAGFNAISQYICHEVFGIVPEMIKFSDARKEFGIIKVGDKKTKISAFEYVTSIYPEFEVKYNKKNNIDKKTYDSSDAVVIAKYFCRIKQNESSPKSDVVIKKTRKLPKTA